MRRLMFLAGLLLHKKKKLLQRDGWIEIPRLELLCAATSRVSHWAGKGTALFLCAEAIRILAHEKYVVTFPSCSQIQRI